MKNAVNKYFPGIINVLRVFRRLIFFVKDYKKIASPGPYKNNFDVWLYLLSRGQIGLIHKMYFDQDFDWGKIDVKIVKALDKTVPSNEGYLLDAVDDLRVRAQVSFIATVIKQNKVKRVLETGTHKAMFSYIAHLCDSSVRIDTFGNLPESQKAVDVLNHEFGGYIHYYLGNSVDTLSGFSPGYKIDFAWVDGGHSMEVCSSDLANCVRLGIPLIAVDDYKWIPDVQSAVRDFMTRYGYSMASISNMADYRGIALLRKN